jgi:hypothetical protein
MRRLPALVVLVLIVAPAHAWNDTGHMVAARLAWNKISMEQRFQVIQILKKHPHYDEFLAARRPEGFSEDEWVFLRAATWADWVRNHHKDDFHHGEWHYINYPFVPPGSSVHASEHQPPADQENIVHQLPVCVDKVKSDNDVDKAVYLCWLFHLAGDVHQPLHTIALFSEQFPNGDAGGNLAYTRFKTNKVKLHPLWDGLLGRDTSPGAIGKVVNEVQEMLDADPDLIKSDLDAHKTFESWAKESFEVAKKEAYLNGELKLADDTTDKKDTALAPTDYAKNAGRTARIQIAKAGERLAATVAQLFN